MSTEIIDATKERPGGLSYRPIEIRDTGGGGFLVPRTFGEVVAFAEIMARSQHAIPKHLRDNPGACLAVTMQALRWGMDPFAVAAKAYNVKDQIAYEAQLIAAVVHTLAPIRRRPVYEYKGEGATLQCIVSVEMLEGGIKTYESPQIGKIVVKNSPLWVSDPPQQLGYFAIRSWARRHTPEVILGVYSPEEREQFQGPNEARDVTPAPSIAQRLQDQTAAAPTKERNGFSAEHVDRETGEITEASTEAQDGQDASEATKDAPDQDESATDAAAPEDDAEKWDDTLLDIARGKANEGGRAWRMFKGGLTVDQQKELADHMKELEKLASAA